MIKPLKALSAIFSTKASKLIVIVVLAGLIATSSAAVFTQYYATTTATIKNADMSLDEGTDDTEDPASFPAIDVDVAASGNTATIAMSLFKDAPTYYTNVLTLTNKLAAPDHDITGATITGLSNLDKLGNVKVYIYATEDPTPSTTECIAYGELTSTSTNPVTFTLVAADWPTLSAEDSIVVEIVGYAASSASAADTVSFTLNIAWN